jgi:uncharacterized membrane protein
MAETLEPAFALAARVRAVPLDQPWAWLAAGWRDMTRVPAISLTYGVGLVAISFAVTLGVVWAGWFYLVLPLIAGFFFFAPVLAVGLYETSRRLERGERPGLGVALLAVRRNGTQIGYFGLLLMLCNLVWVRIATLLFALFFATSHPTFDRLIDALFFSRVSVPFLAVGSLVGFVFAVIVFSFGAVAIPMLVDRPVNVFAAVATSMEAVRLNWKPMALWAALIVVFTSLGLATFYLGLALALPLLGHASWHAYRDLVEPS